MKDEAGAYAAIAAEVKEKYAKAGRKHAGDEVSREIARRWAKANNRKWVLPPRAGAADAAPSVPGKQSRINNPKTDEGKGGNALI